MFVRWKRRQRRHQAPLYDAELVRSVRIHGTPRQQVVGYLGAIQPGDNPMPARCQAFWQRVEARLVALRGAPVTRQAICLHRAA